MTHPIMLFREWRIIIRAVNVRFQFGGRLSVMLSVFKWARALKIGKRLDWAAPTGMNFGHARFRLWYPDGIGRVQGVVVLAPGSNEDGRPQVDEWQWRAFAARNHLALLGCDFGDKMHPQMFIETYANVSRGSGQALLDALTEFGNQLNQSEVAHAPLLLWGMSAGGQFNYEFVAWKPDRVAGFIVNKGGVYYSALLSSEARQVPGLLFIGGKDLAFRQDAIRGLFAINRRAGALWALVEEPTAAHVIGQSRVMAEMFFEDLLALRLPSPSSLGQAELYPLAEKDGFISDSTTHTVRKISTGESGGSANAASWLPTERIAYAWEAVSTNQSLPK